MAAIERLRTIREIRKTSPSMMRSAKSKFVAGYIIWPDRLIGRRFIAPRRRSSAHLHRPWCATSRYCTTLFDFADLMAVRAPFCARARYHGRQAPATRSLVTTLRHFQFLEIRVIWAEMIVIGSDVVENYLAGHAGHKGIKAAQSQYRAWFDIVTRANWRSPEEVKASYPKASILKAGRVVFNIKGNDYRLIAAIQYQAGVLAVRFFGSHAEYDKIDAETV